MSSKKKQLQIEKEPPKKKAWGYGRISIHKKYKDDFSEGHQRTAITNYCNANNLTLFEIFFEEKSGKDFDNRPQATEMMDRLRKGDVIVTTKLDRFTRNTQDLLNKMKDIRDKGASIVFLDFLSVDLTSPLGEAILQIMSTMNQLERKSIGTRTSVVMKDMSSKGILRTRPPFGWKKIEGLKDFVKDDEEQTIIGRIKELIDENPTIKHAELSRILTEEGATLRDCKIIYPSSIRRIIIANKLRDEKMKNA